MNEKLELLELINAAPSPYHTVEASARFLAENGFTELNMSEPWELTAGSRYYVRVYGSTLLAFVAGTGDIRVAAAHTDFPCFRLKPQAGMVREGYGVLNVEKYGGLILRSWLDRPLGLAGKVVLRGADAFAPVTRLVDFKRPLVTIPSLAIHMDREVNEKGALNAQTDMLPLADIIRTELGGDASKDNAATAPDFFTAWLAGELGVEPQDILSYELSTYPCERGCLLGLHRDIVSAPRLDNLTSVAACLNGIVAGVTAERERARAAMLPGSAATTVQAGGLRMIALFDNEEVGSATKQGAGSSVLEYALERIYLALGATREQLLADIAGGFMLSCDVAHALHPNYAAKNDPAVKPVLGGGVVLKQAASQSYAGDAEAIAIIRALCEENNIKWQSFVNRSDTRGGSTLGSIASARVPLRTMDIGIPMLAMHSARETMAASDQTAIEALVTAFLA